MADSLDDLEKEAEGRRRRGGGRTAGAPRFPRSTETRPGADARREELERREQERAQRQREVSQPAPVEKEAPAAEPQTPPTEEPQEGPAGGRAAPQRKRPTSIPFYPNPEHEAFLWRVTAVASERQKRIPATAVLRLALARLEEQMTPSEIVQKLGEVEQPGGRMGRPRL